MKKLTVFILAMALMIGFAYAGEYVTTPQYLVIGSPTTNQAEKISVNILWGSPNRAVITWRVMKQDQSGIFATHRFTVVDRADDPTSITANCTGVGEPWALCTGAGTCTNDCDESTTDFTDFVTGYAVTLNSRAETLIWGNAQDNYPTQATP